MDPLRNLAPGATYKLPSVEQMREEIESGVFSPESQRITQDILADASKLAREERELRDTENEYLDKQQRDKSFIEKQTDDIMKRVTAPVDSMKVDHIKPSDLKKLSKSASKAFEAASQMADATKKVIGSYEKLDFDAEKKRKPDQRGAHLRPLQHRPFFTNAMRVLRDELENQ